MTDADEASYQAEIGRLRGTITRNKEKYLALQKVAKYWKARAQDGERVAGTPPHKKRDDDLFGDLFRNNPDLRDMFGDGR